MYDLLIKNARIVDGTGAPWFRGNVAVKDGRIVAAGRVEGEAAKTVDAGDAYLSPGFIDIHSHSDGTLSDCSIFRCPLAESRILQGVTTELTGNCGMSRAPHIEPDGTLYSVADFLAELDKAPPSVNIAALIGHGAVREAAMGYRNSAPTEAELNIMRALAARSMEEGAFGISSGLIYPPGCYSDTGELIEVARAVAPYGGFYATHMRDERTELIASVKEAIRTAREAGVPLEISHHKVLHKPFWGEICKTTTAMIEEARREGLDVTCDQYPYIATATVLASCVPSWAFEGGNDALLGRLEGGEVRERLARECNKNHEGRWGDIHVSYVSGEKNRWLVGLSIGEIAEKLGKDGANTVFDILLDEKGSAGMINFGMCEEDVEYIMQKEYVMPGSDGEAMPLDYCGRPHPRNFGTFVRVLSHYARDRKLFSLEAAVRKMTSMPAARMGLGDRGLIKAGMWADLVLFDYSALEDTPSYEQPMAACAGIKAVYVNGVLTAKDGHHTGRRAGMALRHR